MQAMDRRRFLGIIGVTAVSAAMPAGRVLAAMAADAIRVSRAHFPQSVASGDPRPDQVLLWTRVAFDALKNNLPRHLRVQVADDAGFTALRVDREVAMPKDSDGCVKLRIEALEPGRNYHYRFLMADGEGGFLSSPNPQGTVTSLYAGLTCFFR